MTNGQSEAALVRQLGAPGATKVFREVASGAKTDRPQLRRLLTEIGPGDVVMVTRFDRLARSTRALLNTLASITGKKVRFRSLADAWAETTTAHGRLMLTVLRRLAEFCSSVLVMAGCFLAESDREWTSIHTGREDFLASVTINLGACRHRVALWIGANFSRTQIPRLLTGACRGRRNTR